MVMRRIKFTFMCKHRIGINKYYIRSKSFICLFNTTQLNLTLLLC